MKRGSVFAVVFFCASHFSMAQITAQGQGGKLVFWNALGIEQSIGKRFTNRNVVAYSRKSAMDSWNPFESSGIFTLREELDYRISKHFKVSGGLLYAQRFYEDGAHPDFIQELRFYPRFYHRFEVGRVKFSQYVRTDFRLFYAPGFTSWHKPFEFRTRYLMKATVPVDKKDRNFLVFITEFLAATDETVDEENRRTFTRFHFSENRSSVFFRHHFPHPDLFFDVGIMNQMWRGDTEKYFHQTLLLQVDCVFVDLFKKKNHKI